MLSECLHIISLDLQFLPRADLVVVMQEGCIVDIGTYSDLIARGVDLQALVQDKKENEGLIGDQEYSVIGDQNFRVLEAIRSSMTGEVLESDCVKENEISASADEAADDEPDAQNEKKPLMSMDSQVVHRDGKIIKVRGEIFPVCLMEPVKQLQCSIQ
jgi:hypothetical protein